ncbi:MAG: LysM peptidoglycan-binding domain-containing protein [Granulosicoccus sp.]|nr:LysM peptidoglycan-binding domain-containing protein [Granulosicoccus sp.]
MIPQAFAQSSAGLAEVASLIMPALGNSSSADRLMLREIGDQHVFDPASSFRQPAEQVGHPGVPPLSKPSDAPPPARTVWQFVQQSRRLKIPENPMIDNYRRQYREEALWISKILNRATPFVGHIVEVLDERYLPVELALLPAIESGYQPEVHSAERAAGIWQIVPVTARDIGVRHTQWFDGRADIVESTVAAADYLSYLNAEFHGDWLLTLAAYNAGPGRVRKAVKQNSSRGLPVDFWSLSLPVETTHYVPKFLALVAMLRHDSLPEFDIPDVERGNGFEVLDFPHRASVDKVAAASGIPESTLKRINAGLVHGVTPPRGPHRLYVLKGDAARIIAATAQLDASELFTVPATHTVAAGDSISTLARLYGLSQARLMELNALDSSVIRIGQQLAVRHSTGDSEGRIEYVVTIGDTLSDIARRFSVRLNRIRDAQGRELATDRIHPGDVLSILIDLDRTG